MILNPVFYINSIFLGIGLAMDAFSVSLANGLHEPRMCQKKMAGIAGVFAGFQALMPMIGWLCVHTFVQYFAAFEPLIPWIALILLACIGGKMIIDGIRGDDGDNQVKLGIGALLLQGIATSIDALSVGFTIADYNGPAALAAALIIAAVTFLICMAGLKLGKRFGTWLADRAQIIGGIILILVGLEIFITGIL
ncbi:MAG: manganese efflux pump MntP family protein [Lachnospiraceae bacterium]|nr:manganese efflux pump MntP family protein [Lachnospiraceae bacterium]